MIKMRNQQELDFQLSIPGTISPSATVKATVHAPFAGFIKSIYAVLGTADGTSGQADIQKNGTSLASSGNLLIFGTTKNGVVTNPVATPLVVAQGDILTLTFPTATGGQAANLSVLITLSKRPVATTESGTIGNDFDTVD
jgi:hypothetical protein